MQKYIPFPSGDDDFRPCMLAGDQLTTERVRSLQMIRAISTSEGARLGSFSPVHADWHAEVVYLQVCMYSIVTAVICIEC